jgi:hypothetical protein
MYVRLHINILTKLNLLDRVSKNAQISNFMDVRPVGAELFHADGQTDMTKLRLAFRNFANAPKNDNAKKSCAFNCFSTWARNLAPDTLEGQIFYMPKKMVLQRIIRHKQEGTKGGYKDHTL